MVLKVVLALILLAHGIGHSMGLLGIFRVAVVNPAWDGDSWVLSGVVGSTATKTIGIALWTIALVGFAVLAGVVMGWLPQDWWRPLAVVSSLASLAGVVLFPLAFPPLSTIGAVAVDVLVLGSALWWDWTPSDLPA